LGKSTGKASGTRDQAKREIIFNRIMKNIKGVFSLVVLAPVVLLFSCGTNVGTRSVPDTIGTADGTRSVPDTFKTDDGKRNVKDALETQKIYDGFEGKGLSEIWCLEKLAGGAVELQSEIVRAGHGAAKITIRQGDRFEKADPSGRDNDTERDELLERKDLYSREGLKYYYSFSIFIPRDFPVVPTRLVLAQWKQQETELKGTVPVVNNPLIAVRYSGGELTFTAQTSREKVTLYKTKEDVRGKWLDFVFWIRFDRTKDGLIKGWMNGVEIINFHGPTAYAEEYGYAKDGRFYFAMGLYRDRNAEGDSAIFADHANMVPGKIGTVPEPMAVYFDEYRKYPLREEEVEADECEGCGVEDLESVE
jgi:hypothetical protein